MASPTGPMSDSFDYVVVGGGTAGCVVAARLAEDPGCSVCLIEAGGSDASPLIRIPMLSFIANSRPDWNWGYKTEANAGFGGRSVGLTQAKVLGGASSINGLLYARGHSREYDRWNLPGWSFSDLLPYFRRSETYDGAATQWRGSTGPLAIRRAESALPIAKAFLAAAASAGYPIVDDLNSDVAAGFGHLDVTVKRGIRQNSALAFLRPARSNLTVLTRSQVRRVVISGGRATGVEVVTASGVRTISARREVILAAGAINSPRLLLLSGLGPAEELRRLGIGVSADLPGVGKNLSNHVRYLLLYEASAPVTAYQYRTPLGAIAGGLQFLFGRKGFLAGTALPIGGLISTDPQNPVPDVNIVLSTAMMGPGPGAFATMPRKHGFSILVRQGTPYSRGEVRLRSADPDAPPIIDARYLSDPRDVAVLAEGVRRTRAIVAQPELARYVAREIQPGPVADDPVAFAKDISAKANNVFHPVGTCRIGADRDAVVDAELRVHGVDGLRVADTSVIPMLVTSGTYALALMVGERAADFIRNAGRGAAARAA